MNRENGTVLLQPSGQELVPRQGQSILDAALEAGVNLPRSCQSGLCGACSARLLEGQVSYEGGRPMGLSEEDEREGKVLLCMARPLGRVRVEAIPVTRAGQAEVKRLPCRVQSLSMLCHDVMHLELRLPAVEPLEFEPGQYVDLMLPGGRRRSFSIAGHSNDGRVIELHVRRVSGGEFTEWVFDELRPGSVLRLEGPFGNFTLQQSSRPWLMLAGGTGLAPIKSMLDQALQQGERRAIRLFWGVRDQRDLYATEILADYARNFEDFRWTPVLSKASGAWSGLTGLVHEVAISNTPDLWAYDIYAAGPPGLVAAVRSTFPEAGANPATIFCDSFDYSPDSRRPIRGDPV
jgi:CDP-4-dehydro-6-deoxyglucose reductase